MKFTIREAMDLGYLNTCSLLAGESGLDRTIESISVIEVPDACSWIRGGELAVTALFGVRDNPERQIELVESFSRSGGSGLIVFLLDGRYLESLSPDLLNTAERLGLPLFQVKSENMTYADLIMPIMEELTLRKFSKDLREAAYGTGAAERFKTCAPVAGALFEKLENTTVLLSPEFEQIEQYVSPEGKPITGLLINQCRRKYESNDYCLVGNGIAKITIPSEPGAMLLCQVRDGHHHLTGYLLIAGYPNSLLSKGKLSFISIALELYEVLHAQKGKADRLQARYQNDFIIDLLEGKLTSVDVILERAQLLDIDMEDRNYVIVISGHGASGKHNAVECAHRALIALDKNVICLVRHSKVVALPKCHKDNLFQSGEDLIGELINHLEADFCKGIIIGIGSNQTSPERLHHSYNDACEAVRLYQILPQKLQNHESTVPIVYYKDLKYLSFFEKLMEDPENSLFCKRTLKPIIEYDSRYSSELLDTMLTYFWEGLDRAKTAKRLSIHRNTLSYRLQKISGLLREDPFSDGNFPKYFTALGLILFEPGRGLIFPSLPGSV
ncbi:MAG: hypothetical protein GX969_05740 [Firmicutes bacterium]|nr:hypothetical protein [Bacillota bacterium]